MAGRLDFAWGIVSILNTPYDGETIISYPSPEKCTTAELLEWLLIDTWPYGCGRFLQSRKPPSDRAPVPQSEPLTTPEREKSARYVA